MRNKNKETSKNKCDICGEKIKDVAKKHVCKILKDEDMDLEDHRTYADKMEEFDKYFNPDKYFDIE